MTSSTIAPSKIPLPAVAAKALPSVQSSQVNVVEQSKTAASSDAPVRVQQSGRISHNGTNLDFVSERATLSLIRRVLLADASHGKETQVSSEPIEGVLPPLTSSNAIDVQLYAIVAIVIRDFVNSWYAKITPDKAFVEEVIQIIAHCSRALEQRVREVDITELILDELPVVVEKHITAYRTATNADAVLQYGGSPRQIYHVLNPHPALDPSLAPREQQVCEATYRQLLIQGTLAVLLPTEDLANACLRTLVADIISDLILGQVLGQKLCEPWFLHGVVSKVIDIVTGRVIQRPDEDRSLTAEDNRSRLEKFGLLSSKTAEKENNSSKHHQSLLSVWLWRLLQYAFVSYQLARFILVGLAHAHHLPRRFHHQHLDGSTASQRPPQQQNRSITSNGPGAEHGCPRAVISYRLYSCTSTLLDLSARMPWLIGALEFGQQKLCNGYGRLGAASSTLDKFLYHTISSRVFSPTLIPPLLQQVRILVFPNNSLGPPAPPPPSAEEAREIRSKAASDILTLFPRSVARTFFAVDKVQDPEEEDEVMKLEIEERLLDWTDDRELNKYLIYGILEHVILRLVPEMVNKTPSELLAERGVDLGEGGDVGMEGRPDDA